MASLFIVTVTIFNNSHSDDNCKIRLGREEGRLFALTTLPAGKRSAAVGRHDLGRDLRTKKEPPCNPHSDWVVFSESDRGSLRIGGVGTQKS
ncbi:hypothetical protein KAM333_40410 [Aeromonas caviae]|nr:hypothetical protein KAM333_40410 [Aeromonas caviae]